MQNEIELKSHVNTLTQMFNLRDAPFQNTPKISHRLEGGWEWCASVLKVKNVFKSLLQMSRNSLLDMD